MYSYLRFIVFPLRKSSLRVPASLTGLQTEIELGSGFCYRVYYASRLLVCTFQVNDNGAYHRQCIPVETRMNRSACTLQCRTHFRYNQIRGQRREQEFTRQKPRVNSVPFLPSYKTKNFVSIPRTCMQLYPENVSFENIYTIKKNKNLRCPQ